MAVLFFLTKAFWLRSRSTHFLVTLDMHTRRIKQNTSLMRHSNRTHTPKRQKNALWLTGYWSLAVNAMYSPCLVLSSSFTVTAAARQMRIRRAWPATAQLAGWDPAGLDMYNISIDIKKKFAFFINVECRWNAGEWKKEKKKRIWNRIFSHC